MAKFLKALTILAVLLVFWRIIDPTFLHFAGDLSFSFDEEVNDLIRFPQLWGVRGAEGSGENTSFILWSYPLTFVLSLLAKFVGSYNVVIILGYVISIVLAMFSIHKLA